MPKTTVINFARLEKLRKEKGWSLTELAEKSDLSRDTLYSIKKGRRGIATATRTLQKIADALGTTIEYLIGEDDEEAATEAKPVIPPTLQELVTIARRLSDVRQEELVRIAITLEEIERETAQRPMPHETYQALVDLFERLRQNKEVDVDALNLLESMIRRRPGRWYVDDRAGERTSDTP